MAEEDLLPLLGFHMQADDDNDGSSDSNDDVLDESDEMEVEDEEENKKEKKDKHKKESKSASNTSITFDTSLPSSHSYLGSDLEELHGRTILDDDAVVSLPLITLPGMILVPGQIIPLHLFHQHTVAMIKNVVEKDKTFGIVAIRTTAESGHAFAGIGTTAEIYSVKDETDDVSGIATIRVKARGRQRFELLEYKRTMTGVLMGKVKILPDVELEDVFKSMRSRAHCRLCCLEDDEENLKTAVDRYGNILSYVNMRKRGKVDRFTEAHYTWWPPWVYRMYDATGLIMRIKSELQKWNETLRPEKMPNDVTELSYWVTQNLPLDDSLRLHLLSINNSVQRLRCALSMIVKYSVLCCQECSQHIADKSEVFSLAVEGPLGAYVNPGGHVHETLTVHKASNLNLIGRPSTEHSWFPGYAWTIAQCRNCASHMGWKFTARSKDLTPQKFWGLCRASLVPGISNPDQSDNADWMPVM